MAKGKKRPRGPYVSGDSGSTGAYGDQGEKPVTLKDRLGSDTLAKLKQQAETLKQEEERVREAKRLEAEAAKEAEKKKQEQDFGYLLSQSSLDWKKYK